MRFLTLIVPPCAPVRPARFRDTASTVASVSPDYSATFTHARKRELGDDQRCVWPTSATYMSKTSTRCLDRFPTCLPGITPEPAGEPWWFTPTTRFSQPSLGTPGVICCRRTPTEGQLLTPRHHPDFVDARKHPLDRGDLDRFHSGSREEREFLRPGTSSASRNPFTGRQPPLRLDEPSKALASDAPSPAASCPASG